MTHPTIQRVIDATKAIGLDIEVVEFDHDTHTAAQAAEAVGCDVAQIVKSLCFMVQGKPVMALVSGANMLFDKKLANHYRVGRKKVKRADPETVKRATSFEVGGVSPFGHAEVMDILIDEDLLRFETVWAAAGLAHTVFEIPVATLVEGTGGRVLDLKKD